MRNFFLVIILGLMSLNLVAQENNNSLNQPFSELIYNQVMNDLEVNVTIMVATPTLIGFMNFSSINNKLFYGDKLDVKNDIFSMSNYSTERVFLELDNQFLCPITNGDDILLTARFKDRILYNININKRDNIERFKISSIDKSYSKTVEFDSGNFKKMNVVKPKKTTILSNDYGSNVQTEIYYQTSNRKYHIKEHQYSGDLLLKTIIYKPTRIRNKKKVKSIIKYQYYDDGNLLSKVRYNKRENKIDSLRYFHDNGHLSAAKKLRKNHEGILTLKTTKNRVSKLYMMYKEKTIDIEYNYNQNGKASRILISRNGFGQEDYRFQYNDKSQLLSIRKYDYSGFLINQVSFEYHNNDILKALILTNNKGKILKEVTYSLSYL